MMMTTTTMMWRTKALSSHTKGRRQKSPGKEKNMPKKQNKDPLQCFFFPLRSFSIHQHNSSPTWKTQRLSHISIKNSPPCQWHLPYHILSLMSCVRFNGNQAISNLVHNAPAPPAFLDLLLLAPAAYWPFATWYGLLYVSSTKWCCIQC